MHTGDICRLSKTHCRVVMILQENLSSSQWNLIKKLLQSKIKEITNQKFGFYFIDLTNISLEKNTLHYFTFIIVFKKETCFVYMFLSIYVCVCKKNIIDKCHTWIQGTTGWDGGYVHGIECRVKEYCFPLKVNANHNWEAVKRGIEQNMLGKYDCKVFSKGQLNGIHYSNNVWK